MKLIFVILLIAFCWIIYDKDIYFHIRREAFDIFYLKEAFNPTPTPKPTPKPDPNLAFKIRINKLEKELNTLKILKKEVIRDLNSKGYLLPEGAGFLNKGLY